MKKILIAGGGTGGHIYPAVAIAQALKKKEPQIVVEFVGTQNGLETKIIPREGFKLQLISASALNNVGMRAKLLSLFVLPLGIVQSILLIIRLKPDVVLGVGGYASGPMMIAAVLLFRKTALFEPNAYPGLTNRWLAFFVSMAFVNFEASKKYFRHAEILGMPVRDGMEEKLLSGNANRGSKESGSRLKILIFGGSQGARGINETVVTAFKSDFSWRDYFEVVHQIGATDWKRFDEDYKRLGAPNVKWFEFLYDMPDRYSWADLIICRAGAATLSELAACGKAAVLIPFPFAADNHQQKNAEVLAASGAAMMVVQKEFTPAKFFEILKYFNSNRVEISKLEKNIRPFHTAGAAEKIASFLLK